MPHLSIRDGWLSLLLIFILTGATGQTKIDSLKNAIAVSQGTALIEPYIDLSMQYLFINADSAVFYGDKALAQATQYNDVVAQARALIAIADGYYFLKKFQVSIDYLHKAEELFEITGDEDNRAETLTKIGINYNRLSNYAEAKRYSIRALEIHKKNDNLKGQWKSISNLGIIAKEIGDLNKSLEYNLESLRITKSLGDLQGATKAMTNIGNTYFALNDMPKALEYYEQSLKLSDSLGNKLSMAMLMNNIATTYQVSSEFDKAEQYYLKSLDQKRELKDYPGMAVTLNNIGFNYYDNQEYEKAEQSFLKALEQSAISEITRSNAYDGLSKIALKKGELKKAENLALKAYQIIENLGNIEQIKLSAETLYKIYNAQNAHEEAFHYLTIHHAAKDSLINEEKLKEIGRLEARYEFSIKEEKLAAEQLQQELNNEIALTRQRTFTFLALIAFFAMAIISFFIYRSQQHKKRANEQLQNKNLEITEQNKEIENQKSKLAELNEVKDRLFTIVSHDLKSPLESLKMLLDLASKQVISETEYKKYLPALTRNVGYTSDLLNNLLQWTQSQMSGEHISREDFNLSAVVENVVKVYLKAADSKNIQIKNEITQPIFVNADKNMIEMVIRNLISNAIKFCRENDTITLTITSNATEAEVHVADTGIGIEPENMEKLFQKGTFSTRGTDNEKGTGLGLMLCKQFVEKNGGEIRVESKRNQGTRFIFTVPTKSNPVVSEDAVYNNSFIKA